MENDRSKELDISYKREISQVAYGNMPALDRLYRKFREPVFLLALSILRDYSLAEDATQETFLKIRENAVSYRGEANPKTWVLTITRNLSLNMLRQRNHEKCSSDSLESTSEKMERKIESAMEFNLVLDQLEEPERSIVTYHIFTGLRHKEIAGIMDMSVVNVRKRYSKAIKKLKVYFEHSEFRKG